MDETYATYAADDEHVDNHVYDGTTTDDHDNNNGLAWSRPVRPGSGPGLGPDHHHHHHHLWKILYKPYKKTL